MIISGSRRNRAPHHHCVETRGGGCSDREALPNVVHRAREQLDRLGEPGRSKWGSRIKNLRYAGAPVTSNQAFIIAINNYRQSGGGNFPGVTTAPVVYNAQVEIRQLLIDWVTANKVIDSSLFSTLDWKLVANGQPVTITG